MKKFAIAFLGALAALAAAIRGCRPWSVERNTISRDVNFKTLSDHGNLIDPGLRRPNLGELVESMEAASVRTEWPHPAMAQSPPYMRIFGPIQRGRTSWHPDSFGVKVQRIINENLRNTNAMFFALIDELAGGLTVREMRHHSVVSAVYFCEETATGATAKGNLSHDVQDTWLLVRRQISAIKNHNWTYKELLLHSPENLDLMVRTGFLTQDVVDSHLEQRKGHIRIRVDG